MSQTNQANARKRAPLAISLGIIAVLGTALVSASSVYTDVLWFDQLGFLTVFTTQIWAQIGVFIASALFAGVVIWLNIYLAWRLRPIYVTSNDFFGRDLSEYRGILDKARKRLLLVIPVVIAVLIGMSQSSEWQSVLLFLNHTYTGVLDPQFNMDVSFYLFDLPFYVSLVSYLMFVTFLALIPAILFHLVYGGIRFNGRASSFTTAARIQIAVLAAFFMMLLGATIWLGQYETLTSASGLFTGATYSDVNASIPAAQILTSIAFVVALLFLAAAVIAKWRLGGGRSGCAIEINIGGAGPVIEGRGKIVVYHRASRGRHGDETLPDLDTCSCFVGMPVQGNVLPTSSSKTIVQGPTGLIVSSAFVDPLVKCYGGTRVRIQSIAHSCGINAARSCFPRHVPHTAQLGQRRQGTCD